VPVPATGKVISSRVSREVPGRVRAIAVRTTRFTLLVPLPTDRTAHTLRGADRVEPPEHLGQCRTRGQGREWTAQADYKVETDSSVWSCDLHSPRQRGTNENMNGLLRQCPPLRTDLAAVTESQLEEAAAELNEPPRDELDRKTPAEMFSEFPARIDRLRPAGHWGFQVRQELRVLGIRYLRLVRRQRATV